MKNWTRITLGPCVALLTATVLAAHGGQYLGPGDTVPPGGSGGGRGPVTGPVGPSGPDSGGPGPGNPAPGNPGSGRGAPVGGGGAPVSGGGAGGPDLTAWTFWWEFNKEPYLQLKNRIWDQGTASGYGGFYHGKGAKDQGKDIFRPSQTDIRERVVPALLDTLKRTDDNDILTGCMIALAKIGDVQREDDTSQFADALEPLLRSSSQEVSETAAVALGILGHTASIKPLSQLLLDESEGRDLIGRSEVPLRTRSFAAFGLGQVGASAIPANRRVEIVELLTRMLEEDRTSTRDLSVACLVGLGLVPVDTMRSDPEGPQGPSLSLQGQLEFVLRYFEDAERHELIRAHAPIALARLLERANPGLRAEYQPRIAEALLAPITARVLKEDRAVLQSCVLALGLLGDSDEDALDKRIRAGLLAVTKKSKDQQVRAFSMIALAKVGSRTGDGEPGKGRSEAMGHLLGQLGRKSPLSNWASLGLGVLGHAALESGDEAGLVELSAALRLALSEEKAPDSIGSLAVAAGLTRDVESGAVLLDRLAHLRDEDARGYVAVGLGLMGQKEAVDPLRKILSESSYRPVTLAQSAIALGLLGDKEVVLELTSMLSKARSLSTQAAAAKALGFIGDKRSIEPLVAMLQDDSLTGTARAFAAVALGTVADHRSLPWNAKLSVDLNYRASTPTLTNPEGTGILDIL